MAKAKKKTTAVKKKAAAKKKTATKKKATSGKKTTVAKKKATAGKKTAAKKKTTAKKAPAGKKTAQKKAAAKKTPSAKKGAAKKKATAKKAPAGKKAAQKKATAKKTPSAKKGAAKKTPSAKKGAAGKKSAGRKSANEGAKKTSAKKKATASDATAKKGAAKKKAAGKKTAGKKAAADGAKKTAAKKKAGKTATAQSAPVAEPAIEEPSEGVETAPDASEANAQSAGDDDMGKGKGKAKGKDKAKSKAKGKRKKKTLADKADRHILYQLSVQSPEADIEFFTERYKELRGRDPKVLREDFCGTAYLSATWAASADDRRAVGVDLDEPTLEWGRKHNIAAISKKARARVDLRQENVLEGGGEPADITCAMNFSYGVFKTRPELRRYFEVAHQALADDGMFITELYGGTEGVIEVLDERDIEDPDGKVAEFTYIWEQAAYNPITHDTLCHIHFKMGDGSKIKKAFTYDWRLWSIPEMRELLYEAGFTSVRVFWEATDKDGDGTGEYYPTEKEDNQESWLVYIVAAK